MRGLGGSVHLKRCHLQSSITLELINIKVNMVLKWSQRVGDFLMKMTRGCGEALVTKMYWIYSARNFKSVCRNVPHEDTQAQLRPLHTYFDIFSMKNVWNHLYMKNKVLAFVNNCFSLKDPLLSVYSISTIAWLFGNKRKEK